MLVDKRIDNFKQLNWLDEFLIGHKGFIAGGCFKNIFNKDKVRDLDIFFESMSDWEDATYYFDRRTPGYMFDDKESEEYTFYYENKNVKAYKHIKTGIVLELCCKIFGTPEQILDQFDFTIVKFAYYKKKVKDEDGNESIQDSILCDDCFFEHLFLKRLCIDNNINFPASTFERMFKYARYGYFPCKETKLKLINALKDLSDSEVDLSASLYDGVD